MRYLKLLQQPGESPKVQRCACAEVAFRKYNECGDGRDMLRHNACRALSRLFDLASVWSDRRPLQTSRQPVSPDSRERTLSLQQDCTRLTDLKRLGVPLSKT
ncbi:hypothetical protein RRG08_018381 [Elysia crispata]|uniref:Uncharacterized protein n=1 Tax=Elysia crispata TaxID=231223 RepID=A0AAE0YM84_9GAST|nr:hypothetical protein RRG08_018381 [Elysia crispata]